MLIHHVQLACPPGGEEEARRFYARGLGMTEVRKPPALQPKGGCWFRAWDDERAVTAEFHIGVEEDFRPARKAHPALLLRDAIALEETAARLQGAGFCADWTQRRTFEGYERFHTHDAHGNRLEIMAPAR